MMTEHYELKQLLNLYYSGLTTPDDEKRLVKMFESIDELPEELAADRDIVIALAGEEVEIPKEAPVIIGMLVDKLESRDKRYAAGRRFIAFTGVAASLAIVVSLVLFIVRNGTPNPYEITDPQTAFNETERALLMVSEGLNKTDAFMDEASHTLSKITFIDDSLFEEEYIFEDSVYNDVDDERI